MRRGEYPRRQVRTRHGMTWQVRLEPIDPGTSLAPTVAPVVDVEPTVQALLAYLRERDQQRAQVVEVRTLLSSHDQKLDAALEHRGSPKLPWSSTGSARRWASMVCG
jgi:hypothetical protein